MDADLRELVRRRAASRCEYCLIHQDDDPFFRFHIEHVLPIKHGGLDDVENLALACRHCNLHKGSKPFRY
jgi:5-methylcytosine-specific restriction endonuclease McrA